MANNVLLWFKNDLRLLDNESLLKAIASGKHILPVYIFDTETFRDLALGFPKTDLVRLQFAIQCVEDLRKNLQYIGGNLMIKVGKPEDLIPKLCKQYECDLIFAEREFATEELNLIKRVEQQLPKTVGLNLTWGRTLYHLDDIPYKINDIPLTSKTFRINTTKNTEVREAFAKPTKIKCIALLEEKYWGQIPKFKELGFEKKTNFSLTYMEGGESQALDRLNYYLFDSEQLTDYRWTRNRSLGLDYSSKFSPYMALGCLSARTIYESVKRYELDVKKNQSTWWIIFEIMWRDYFTFKLMRFQNQIYKTEGYAETEREFTNHEEWFNKWCKGETGIPFIDAHMRQLNETGFMSNRGRVNCASFVVHDYKIDWTWGAAYFESKLIDYDVASNWMNWHTQAYQIYYTNPVNQANKYNAQEFIRKWVQEIKHLDDKNILVPWECDVQGYPKPVEIFRKWTRAINKIKSIEV